jgi:uncharacterized protein (DUF1501 family)
MYSMNNKIFIFGLSERLMELQRRDFLKLGGVATGFGVVLVASASRQAVTSSSERIVLVVCNASRYTSLMDNEVTQPDFFVLVGP